MYFFDNWYTKKKKVSILVKEKRKKGYQQLSGQIIYINALLIYFFKTFETL